MKKLKKAMAAILLTMLVMQMSYTQSKESSNKMQPSQFNIKLAKQVYSKEEVEKILLICLGEMNKNIDASFAEGYKQGLLAASPDAEYYKTLSLELEREVKRLNHKMNVPWWSIPLSVLGGTALGFGFAQIRW
ncbi:hypothetical protein [Treponema denticola]|uniref:hypothetical protein n=1 Tax=Treponema denticola TaxID=158 RepID=UPI0020A31B89|nr:hypothetical protein [Treponema denticola]